MRNAIPTIGYFGPRLDAHYQTVLWNGIVEEAKERGCNLVCFPGERLNSRENYEYQANILYKLAHKQNVDGLIILTTAIGILPSIEQITEFCLSYKPVPVVSVGLLIPNIPSVVIDNAQGMKELATHLIEHHGFSKYAFISGPEKHQEAEIRLDTFRKVLEDHGISLDPELILQGDFTQESGFAASEELISSGKKFDVLVAANDYMAKGALESLKFRGIRVPEQVALAGFDDIISSSYCTPPISTVFHPMHEEGRTALSLLVDVIEKKNVSYHVTLPSHVQIRESCGCFSYESKLIKHFEAKKSGIASLDEIESYKKNVFKEIQYILRLLNFPDRKMIEDELLPDLIHCFYDDIRIEGACTFINNLNTILRHYLDKGHDVNSWASVVLKLRHAMPAELMNPESSRRAERLCEQSLMLIGEISRRLQGFLRTESEWLSRKLWEIGHALITSFDLEKLVDVIIDAVERLCIRRCYFSLYEKDHFPDRSRLYLAYEDGKKLNTEQSGLRFQTIELIPSSVYPHGGMINLIVEPLYFQEDQLGFIVFEMTASDTKVYDSLRQQLSSALKGAFLMQEITGYTQKLEQEVSERTSDLTEANVRLKAEIKQRKQADAALKASEKNFRKITEAAPIPLLLARIADGKILYNNKHFSTIFGFNGKTKKNRHIGYYFQDPDYITEIIEKLKRSDSIPDVELSAIRERGERFSVIASFQTIVYGGEKAVLAGFYDITERKRLEKEILEISGREQRRIGQDLHDDLCQNLAGIAVMLSAFEKNLGSIDRSLAERASSISEHINDTIVRTRSLARGLYPAALEESGLAYMLQELSNNIQGQFGVECSLSVEERFVLDDNSVALHLYRIAQEATANAIRHGKPTLIEIEYISNEDEVVLSVHDNGKGFSMNKDRRKGMGLRIMNYRANMIGAKLDIRGGASGGATLTCVLKRKG